MIEKNKVYHEDCIQGMKRITSGTVDMILTDPCYGTTKCDWDMKPNMEEMWKEFKRVIKPNGAIVISAKQPFTTELIESNRRQYRYNWYWIKNVAAGYMNAKIMPLQSIEDLCVFYKKKPKYNAQMEEGFERKRSKATTRRKCKAAEVYGKAVCVTDYDSEARYPINVLYFEVDQQKERLQSGQKPVAMYEYLIKTYTDEGETVLDAYGGSGTTAIACINTKRNFIIFENKKEHYKNIKERIGRQCQ